MAQIVIDLCHPRSSTSVRQSWCCVAFRSTVSSVLQPLLPIADRVRRACLPAGCRRACQAARRSFPCSCVLRRRGKHRLPGCEQSSRRSDCNCPCRSPHPSLAFPPPCRDLTLGSLLETSPRLKPSASSATRSLVQRNRRMDGRTLRCHAVATPGTDVGPGSPATPVRCCRHHSNVDR